MTEPVIVALGPTAARDLLAACGNPEPSDSKAVNKIAKASDSAKWSAADHVITIRRNGTVDGADILHAIAKGDAEVEVLLVDGRPGKVGSIPSVRLAPLDAAPVSLDERLPGSAASTIAGLQAGKETAADSPI